MYRKVDDFLEEWTSSAQGTDNVIKAITDDKLNQAIVPDHSTLGWLAWHLVQTAGTFGNLAGLKIQVDGLHDSQPTNVQQISEAYETVAHSIKEETTKLTDAALLEEVDSFAGKTTRGKLLRMLIDHQTHHRGQMTVLLRQAGLIVPPVMGPTKEMSK